MIDLSAEVHQIYKELDPVQLEHIYQKVYYFHCFDFLINWWPQVLPQMEGLFENIFQLWDSKCLYESFEINEETIEEVNEKPFITDITDTVLSFPFSLFSVTSDI